MPIPDFQSIMLPLLQLGRDGEVHKIQNATRELAEYFNLTKEEKSRLLPSGQSTIFYNRVGWAKTHIKKAGLIEDTNRGQFKITEKGKLTLQNNPKYLDMNYLKQFPEYSWFRKSQKSVSEKDVNQDEDPANLTPDETLESAFQKIKMDLSDKLLEYISISSPGFFEKLVVGLLVKMGYGGTQQNAARAVGRSGDGGIDGIIDEDRLGLDSIYIQAKRWQADRSVGRPEIQRFVGALQGKRAKKGVFITTSSFTSDARDYAKGIDLKIVLIDGERLTELMIDFGVGVTTSVKYEIKKIDLDYFVEISSE